MPRTSDLDRAEANAARTRFRVAGVRPMPADPELDAPLAPGEWLIAARRAVRIDRRQRGEELPPCGDLYVTSERVLVVGRTRISILLDDIEDAALLGGALVLVLRGGNAVTVETDRPRLLRVQVAAARSTRRRRERVGAGQLSPR